MKYEPSMGWPDAYPKKAVSRYLESTKVGNQSFIHSFILMEWPCQRTRSSIRSLLAFFASFFRHPALFREVSRSPSPVVRASCVPLAWACLHGSHQIRHAANSVAWTWHEALKTTLVSQQLHAIAIDRSMGRRPSPFLGLALGTPTI